MSNQQIKNPGLGVSTEARAGCSAQLDDTRWSGDVPDHAGERMTHSPVVSASPVRAGDIASRNNNLAERSFSIFCASKSVDHDQPDLVRLIFMQFNGCGKMVTDYDHDLK